MVHCFSWLLWRKLTGNANAIAHLVCLNVPNECLLYPVLVEWALRIDCEDLCEDAEFPSDTLTLAEKGMGRGFSDCCTCTGSSSLPSLQTGRKAVKENWRRLEGEEERESPVSYGKADALSPNLIPLLPSLPLIAIISLFKISCVNRAVICHKKSVGGSEFRFHILLRWRPMTGWNSIQFGGLADKKMKEFDPFLSLYVTCVGRSRREIVNEPCRWVFKGLINHTIFTLVYPPLSPLSYFSRWNDALIFPQWLIGV